MKKKYAMILLLVSLAAILAFSGCLDQADNDQSTDKNTPCPVRDLNATDKIPGVATLTWNMKCPVLNNTNGTSIAFYKIYRNGEHIANSNDNQYLDYNVEPNEEYTYQVSAVSTEGIEGPKSDSSKVTIKPGMPGV